MNEFNSYLSVIKIITGKRNIGKTSFCSRLSYELQNNNIQVKGVLSPGFFLNGKKVEIWVEDIYSATRKMLAIFDPGWDPSYPKREWRLREDAIVWGNEILDKSIPAEVLIIDELGFLEFEKKSGWLSAFHVLDERKFQFAFVVVRPQFIKHALTQFGNVEIIDMDNVSDIDLLIDTYFELIRTELVK
jgi:nucleoside-triphosphatase THEP1